MTRSREATDAEMQEPLTPAMFHVLLALADGEKHGYAILKEVARRTGGKVQLSAGTLYGIIKRLNAEAWIVESNKRPVAGLDDERRRYYRLTEAGKASFTSQKSAWSSFSGAVETILGGAK